MNEKHHDSLRQYVNDMIAVERNITSTLKLQMADERVQSFHQLRSILDRASHASESRIQLLKKLATGEYVSFVAEELAGDAPLANPAAVQLASTRIRAAWSHR